MKIQRPAISQRILNRKVSAFTFTIHNSQFTINCIGHHNMENALAAVAVANQIGVDLETCASSLKNYEGIYRRNQVLGNKNGVWVIDDYAHNPVKCASAIAACQPWQKKWLPGFSRMVMAPQDF